MLKTTTTVLVLLSLFGPSTSAANREQLRLDGEWGFTYTGSSTAKIPDLPPPSAYDVKLKVPGRWDDQLDRMKQSKWWSQAVFRTSLGPVQYLSGTGWHRRTIDVPKKWQGRAAALTIGHAVGTTHVWLNGKHLGTNKIGVYTPYQIDLTNVLKPGESNELIIAVDNSFANIFGGWAFLGNAGMASGLARSVTLDVAAGPGRIADVFVRPGEDLQEVVWEAELSLPGARQSADESKLEWLVRDPKTDRELGRGTWDVPAFSKYHKATWKARFNDIKPWSDREPNLYVTQVRWIPADGQAWDTREQRFGLRRWSYDGRKLFLNGEPHYLRLEFGAYYFPIDGAVAVSKDYWVRHMRRVKELGLNGVNFAAQVCPIEMMEAADEYGVILQCGDQETTRPEVKDQYKEVWDSIVRTTRAHPSMTIYGFGGELKYYEGVIEQNKAQMDLIKSLDPDSLVMPQQAIHGIDYGIENGRDPGVRRRPFLHHAERLARYTEACDLFGHYSGGAFSHNYIGIHWRTMENRFLIYKKPLIAHELFISASYLNPDNIQKYTGRIPPYIYTRLEKDLKEAGLFEKWPTYFDHTSRLQHICRKYCMEKVRKCNELAGFELLGMMDMHFTTPEYAVGMVDEFLAMKPGDTPAGIRKYNDESVLLLDFDEGRGLNCCYWAGDSFQADIMASLFGAKPLEKGTLKWSVTRDGETLLDGTEELAAVANGGVSTLKKLSINWPAVDSTTRMKLAVELKGSGYNLANDWDFWVFPKQPAPQVAAAADAKWQRVLSDRYPSIGRIEPKSTDKLRVVSKLSASDIEHLDRGGDVVLLGTAPFTAYTRWPQFVPSKGYRPFSNGGTIIAKHPIFAGHPNNGWNDWLFYPLMQGANSILFDGAIAMEFDPIMELISSAGHVRKQALVFENRVGQGRLLVAPLVFDMKNPSCVTLLDSVLKYAQSDEFRPRHSIDVNELMRATSPNAESANQLVDPGFERSGYWMTEGGKFEIDDREAHNGRKSLKLVITKEDLSGNRNFASSVSTRQITFDRAPKQLRLAAWFKTDVQGQRGGPTVRATFRYADAHIRSSSFSVSMPQAAPDWSYVEKIIDLDGTLTVANVYIDLTGVQGTAWVDDVFFGEAPAGSKATANDEPVFTEDGPEWSNKKVTRRFDSPVWYQIDKNEWTRGSTLTVDQEGVHTLAVKESETDADPKQEQLRIDLTPPVVTLEIDPLPEQEAGVFTASGDARYTLKATDGLSGVKSIEFSIDGKVYQTYKKPFSLLPGRQVLHCRATDRAGNISTKMTGEWITGTDDDALELNVLSVGK
jgi:hypothetical protein